MVQTKVFKRAKVSPVKPIPVSDQIATAVERFDMEGLKSLLPDKPTQAKGMLSLHTGLEKIFTLFHEQGYESFKALTGECSCMAIHKGCRYKVVAFHTEHILPAGGCMYRKEFALVFLDDKKRIGEYKYFQFCARGDWKSKYGIYI